MFCYLYYLYIDQNGLTALLLAAGRGHRECLSILLAHGAEVDKAEEVSVRGECTIAEYEICLGWSCC